MQSDMEDLPPASNLRIEVSDHLVTELVQAVNALEAASRFVLTGLRDVLRNQPVVERHRLTEEQRQFFIDASEMTSEELDETERQVDRGSLQLGGAKSWLLSALDTRSLQEIADYMDLTEEETVAAVSEGRLYGVEIAGSLRFPTWQMNVGRSARTVKGLDRIIAAAATAGWGWQRLSAYFVIPQEDLIEEGRLTPLTWLQDIGDVDKIVSLIEASVWR